MGSPSRHRPGLWGRSRCTSAAVPPWPVGFGGPSPSPCSPWVVPESGYPGNIPAVSSLGSLLTAPLPGPPLPGSQPHSGFVPSLPALIPSRGFLGDKDFRRASQAPCAAAQCAGMFFQSRRAAESRIITGNVPGGERGAAWERGHLHGPGTALRAGGSLQPGTGVPPAGSPRSRASLAPHILPGAAAVLPAGGATAPRNRPVTQGKGTSCGVSGCSHRPNALGRPKIWDHPQKPPGTPSSGVVLTRGVRGSLGCIALVSLPGHLAQPGHRRPPLL